MFKYVRYGLVIAGLVMPFLTQANACNGKSLKICDFTFTATPTYSNMCIADVASGIYTIRNNTPVPVKINYIRVQDNDALPNAATAIVAAPTNSCVVGRSLAPGATCNIKLNLLPLMFGQFNRTLQVGIDTRQIQIAADTITSLINCLPSAPAVPEGPVVFPFPPPPGPFAFACTVLAASTVTNTGESVVNGNVCLSPGTSITGFPPGMITNGIQETDATSTMAADAQIVATTLYNTLAGLPCDVNLTGQDLGGKTLTPGVYCFDTSAALTGALTLNAQGNPDATFVFQIGSTLTTAAGSSTIPAASVTLINSAQKKNVFWQVGTSATLGTYSEFQGTIVAYASITIQTGAQLLGTAIARTGAVTLDTNSVNPV